MMMMMMTLLLQMKILSLLLTAIISLSHMLLVCYSHFGIFRFCASHAPLLIVFFQYDKDIGPTETYLAMEKLVKKGLVRAIGVSNFNSEQIAEVLEKAEIKPATNQVECHPYFNQAK